MASAARGQSEEEAWVERQMLDLGWIVEKVARPWRDGVDHDTLEDLRQEARLGVWRAVTAYEPGRGARLSTFAYRCASCRVLDFLRAFRRGRELEAALEEAAAEARAGEPEPPEAAGSAEEWTPQCFVACLGREDLRAAYRRLSPQKQAVIAWSFGGRETNPQIAARLHERVEAVKKTRQRAIREVADAVIGPRGRLRQREG